MIPATGLSVNSIVLRTIFLFTVALLGACDDADEPVKQELQTEAVEPPLPVKEWYPSPKHMQQPQAYSQPPALQYRQMTPVQPPAQGSVSQQIWALPLQQPVYTQQPPVYTQQPPVIVYQLPQHAAPAQPQGWTYQQPADQPSQSWSPTQQLVPGYQSVPRPWGDVGGANGNRQTGTYSESWPSNSYYSPGGVPAGGGDNTWGTGQYGTVPGGYYGKVW